MSSLRIISRSSKYQNFTSYIVNRNPTLSSASRSPSKLPSHPIAGNVTFPRLSNSSTITSTSSISSRLLFCTAASSSSSSSSSTGTPTASISSSTERCRFLPSSPSAMLRAIVSSPASGPSSSVMSQSWLARRVSCLVERRERGLSLRERLDGMSLPENAACVSVIFSQKAQNWSGLIPPGFPRECLRKSLISGTERLKSSARHSACATMYARSSRSDTRPSPSASSAAYTARMPSSFASEPRSEATASMCRTRAAPSELPVSLRYRSITFCTRSIPSFCAAIAGMLK
mmetsp:Transcript_25701/g.52384  ORF Transcript_25701/g.52384 Transcript_25701/m.52384 type:complete len:288 (+) Transcript_25701:466-1329(+)